ncbi:extracellular solute-binding protein [Microbacterium sp. NC79]|uniref:extracellular solute-binding protein n=1 Tax=Microbacterium sp. NC79 TaxID=2851009 RepID=UPI001C2C7244|nr:extracellular solute-binding protein [Microbacterium sp. NC79]MBV0894208.1 extracellular solute-binding protein [Microbacterium sp. NC79]
MNRKLAAVATFGVAALALAGCSSAANDGGNGGDNGGSAETGELTVWIIGSDTPQDARDYLKETFEAENEGWTLAIEEKTWADTNDAYVAALGSSDAPDVVEVGNTQAQGFIDQGLLLDITSEKEALGGDTMLQSFVELGSADDALYAVPYYAGSRIVFYSPEVFTGEPPATLEEYVAAGKAMKTDTRSGIWAPGKDWYNALAFVWANGGEVAVKDGDKWDAQFSSPESIKGLEMLQDVYLNANVAPADSNEADPQVPFCLGETGFLSAPSWVKWSILAAADADNPGCPDTYGKDLQAMPLPGMKAGEAAPVFAGGSSIAVAFKSDAQDKAKAAVAIMLSDGYQKIMAENGLIPALTTQAQFLPDDEITKASAAATAASRAVPASANWAGVEASLVIPDTLVKIAQGGDIKPLAEELDKKIEEILNK